MNRREALLALGAGAGASTFAHATDVGHAASVVHAAEAAAGVLAWSDSACWVGRAGRPLRPLGEGIAPGIAPVATARGIWLVDAAGLPQRWQIDADGTPRPDQRAPVEPRAHALAASADGAWALVAHGERLSLFDIEGRLRKVYEGTDLGRRRRGAASRLFAHTRRRSFVATWPALEEIWEISLDPGAPPLFDGLVHDYRLGEGIASAGFLGVRRTLLPGGSPDVGFAHPQLPWVAGTSGADTIVVHLDVRRAIARFALPGARPAAATIRPLTGRLPEWWLPIGDEVQVIATDRWAAGERHRAPGRVIALATLGHEVLALLESRRDAAGSASGPNATSGQLHAWRAGAWTPLTAAPSKLVAMQATSDGSALLVASVEPAALARLAPDGRMLERWSWPEAASTFGMTALPG